jgi:hypothetical protein
MTEEKKTEDKKTSGNGMAIVGINLAIYFGYAVICIGVIKAVDFFLFLLAVHVVACVLLSIIKQRWVWFLSGLLVLIIGFSTCVGQL